MRILHFCVNYYVENMEYQENVLPRKHKLMGYDVRIVCGVRTFSPDGKKIFREPGRYTNRDGIEVTIIPYRKGKLSVPFHIFEGAYESIEECAPDIIFVHCPQSYSMRDIVRYKKNHPQVKIYVDNHMDYINTDITKLSHRIIQKFFFGRWAREVSKVSEMMWGVTPLRVCFLQDVYNIPAEKTGLLVMGGDETKIDFEHRDEIRKTLRSKHSIDEKDFLVVTGGKIDNRKNFELLMQAVADIPDERLKLVVFGTPSPDMEERINSFCCDRVIKIGWISSDEAYMWFLAADLAVFPGTHSVLWEQAAATGIPMVVKHWDGMDHIDVGGNCLFLHKDSVEEIKEVLLKILGDEALYNKMKEISETKAKKHFQYLEIAKRAIGLE